MRSMTHQVPASPMCRATNSASSGTVCGGTARSRRGIDPVGFPDGRTIRGRHRRTASVVQPTTAWIVGAESFARGDLIRLR